MTDRLIGLQSPAIGADAATERTQQTFRRQLPDGQLREGTWVFAINDDRGERVGHLWLGVDHGKAVAYDVFLDDPATSGATVRGLAEDYARSQGASDLRITVFPGDPSHDAFVDGGGFEPAATDMSLPLTDANLPEDQRISLRPMTQEQFDEFYAYAVSSYAESRAKAGLETPEQAIVTSREQFVELLPDGKETKDNQLWQAYDGSTNIGMLWIESSGPRAFVYDIVVEESQRRRGYGASIMNAGARWSQEHGSTALGLNVFGYNDGARALYEKLGYTVNSETVQKPL